MGEWDAWVGRTEVRHDRIDEAALGRWLATLDRDAAPGGKVPQGYHWCVTTPDASTSALGEDGHPRRNDDPQALLPPVPLPRRMWAASSVAFLRPLCEGQALSRHSRVAAITAKQGGSGKLVFVDLTHEMRTGGEIAIRELQSIVYRETAAPDAPLQPPKAVGVFDPAGWDVHRVVTPTPPLLFRYSALTFNSHRIHYDRLHAQDEERYRGLVVQGPLTATLLLDLARRRFGDNQLRRLEFRGLSPAIADEPLHLVLRGDTEIELAAFAEDGRQVMKASAAR